MPLPAKEMFFDFRKTMTDEQITFVNSIIDNMVTVVESGPGTGKTQMVVNTARYLQRDLIYVFSPIEEDDLGYRPGSNFEKIRAYLSPLFDALEEIGEDPEKCVYNEDLARDPRYKKGVMENMKKGNIWVFPTPHTFLRGNNLKGNKVVFIDEAQNFTKLQLKKATTRLSDDAKLILGGHLGQIDLRNPTLSGFPAYKEFYGRPEIEYAQVIELNHCFRGRIARDADTV